MEDKYPNGLIAWTDLAASDVDAAKEFYANVFGWKAEDQFHEEQLVYTMFSKDGKTVAGLGKQPAEMREAGVPPLWTTYINVDDVDAVAAAFTAHGGQLMMPPMDVMDAGRMAYGMDAVGAAIGFWQAKNHRGADHFNDPGFMTWNELTTRNVEEAVAFWQAVMPWKAEAMDMGGGMIYHMLSLGDRPNGGVMAMDENWPADIPSHWMVYFRVADTDATVAKVTEAGGTVAVPPFDTPQGRAAVINDPQGGTFSIIDPAPASD